MSTTTPARALVSDWLRQPDISRHVELMLDDDGCCSIGHESGIDCALEVPLDQEAIYLSTPLLPIAAADETVLRLCMRAHLFGRASGGATYAIDDDSGWLVLWRRYPIAALDADDFAHALVDFLTAASTCRSGLLDHITNAPAA